MLLAKTGVFLDMANYSECHGFSDISFANLETLEVVYKEKNQEN